MQQLTIVSVRRCLNVIIAQKMFVKNVWVEKFFNEDKHLRQTFLIQVFKITLFNLTKIRIKLEGINYGCIGGL